MKFSVVTIFPALIEQFLAYGLIAKAVERGLVQVDVYDLREYSGNKHRKVDDRPFGGGAGMVLMAKPLINAIEAIEKKESGQVILMSPYARLLDQKLVKKFSKKTHLIILCGRYEGVDQRVIDKKVDMELSIGEYVLMGGEVAAEVLIESVCRMVPGVVGNIDSVETDTFFNEGQFGYPQYTQPRTVADLDVPEILLSGHHKEIDQWRRKNQKRRKK